MSEVVAAHCLEIPAADNGAEAVAVAPDAGAKGDMLPYNRPKCQAIAVPRAVENVPLDGRCSKSHDVWVASL